jgi:diguanylate cyclase (GGDEF)-like protein/PAS domain S-box-containing protein
MMMNRNLEQPQSLENEFARVTLDSMAVGVVRTDRFGNLTYLNRMAEKLTGWGREEALGRPLTDVIRITDRISREAFRNAVKIVIQEGKTSTLSANGTHCHLLRRDGSEFEIENTLAPIHDKDDGIAGAVLTFHDSSATHTRLAGMRHLAEHDSLTGLPNRTLFDDRLKQAIAPAGRQGKQLAVMFVDLDQFKRINDSLGHEVGDKLLQSIAGRLKASVWRTDTVSRLGGDEFLVLLSQIVHAEDAAISVRKILREFASPHIIDGKSIDINASIGVSTYPTDGSEARTLINKADAAMYDAKQHGRNGFRFFLQDMQERISDRQLLEGDLRYALGRNEFVLHYQPKFNLQTGQIIGVEALIRWTHPQRGMVSPALFVPIAEECGLILPIGRWVLLEACKQARAWSDSGLGNLPIAVNVSATEFADKEFISGVRTVLISTGVEPSNLELELTESVLMRDAESTVRTLDALKAMGVRLAIDDFGTGYSSFTYLRRFAVDTLKLDQSFVQKITQDLGDATIVSAMINIGNSLGLRVIAEGVETKAHFEFLQSHGCSEGQGYFFSRPVVAEQAGKLLEASVRERVAC